MVRSISLRSPRILDSPPPIRPARRVIPSYAPLDEEIQGAASVARAYARPRMPQTTLKAISSIGEEFLLDGTFSRIDLKRSRQQLRSILVQADNTGESDGSGLFIQPFAVRRYSTFRSIQSTADDALALDQFGAMFIRLMGRAIVPGWQEPPCVTLTQRALSVAMTQRVLSVALTERVLSVTMTKRDC